MQKFLNCFVALFHSYFLHAATTSCCRWESVGTQREGREPAGGGITHTYIHTQSSKTLNS